MNDAVITGIGVLAPTGLGAQEHWDSTIAGRSGIARIEEFDPSQYRSQVAGRTQGFDPTQHLPGQLLAQTDHMTRLALVAADWAIADSQLDLSQLPEYGAGVVTASSAGGFEFGHRQLENLWSKGPQYVSAYQSFAWFYAVNSGQISIRHGLRGPSGVVVTEQAGGIDALAQARTLVREGMPAMIAGGVDGSPCPWGWIAHQASGRLSTQCDPDEAYLPFDPRASGSVPGDGGAMFVIESSDRIAGRDAAQVYGRIAGYAATFDPAPGSGRPPTLARAIELALSDAELVAADVDVVFADAAGAPELDREEAEAIGRVFGPRGVPVTAPKALTGRLAAGGAALDVATALLAMQRGVLPATPGEPVPAYELDLVCEPRKADVDVAVVLARGYGGHNAAMVLTRYPQRP